MKVLTAFYIDPLARDGPSHCYASDREISCRLEANLAI